MLDEKRIVGTDIATWFLFHPDDLAHRLQDPAEWCWHEFAVCKEFASGNLVAINTAADAAFLIRFTDQALTEQEQLHAIASVTFRLCVRHHCLYLDGGDLLPSAEMFDDGCDPGNWLEISNGNYQVTVFTFDWKKRSKDADLPSYMVKFQPVESLDAIDSPTLIPRMVYAAGLVEQSDPRQEWLASITSTLESEYALQQWPEMVFPGFHTTLLLNSNQYQSLELINTRYNHLSRRKFEIVMGHALEPQSIGTLFRVEAHGHRYDQLEMLGVGKQLVRLLRVFERDDLSWAEVEPYNPPYAPSDAASLEHLKRLFAQYAETSTEYPRLVQYPQFYAERIASLSVAQELSWAIAYAIDLAPEVQRSLLIMSDQDSVQQLSGILEQTLQ